MAARRGVLIVQIIDSRNHAISHFDGCDYTQDPHRRVKERNPRFIITGRVLSKKQSGRVVAEFELSHYQAVGGSVGYPV